jgi:hypothetical protein
VILEFLLRNLTSFSGVPLRVHQVIVGTVPDMFEFFFGELAFRPRRTTDDESAVFENRILGDKGPCADETVFADLDVIHENRAHADESAVTHGAAVKHDVVTYGHSMAQRNAALSVSAVKGAIILNISLAPDLHLENVAANDGAEPNRRFLGDLDVTDHRRRRRDPSGLMNFRVNAIDGNNHGLTSVHTLGVKARSGPGRHVENLLKAHGTAFLNDAAI